MLPIPLFAILSLHLHRPLHDHSRPRQHTTTTTFPPSSYALPFIRSSEQQLNLLVASWPEPSIVPAGTGPILDRHCAVHSFFLPPSLFWPAVLPQHLGLL